MNAEKIGHLADELEKTERLRTNLKGITHPWQIKIDDFWVPKRVGEKVVKVVLSAIEVSVAELRDEIRKAAGAESKR